MQPNPADGDGVTASDCADSVAFKRNAYGIRTVNNTCVEMSN